MASSKKIVSLIKEIVKLEVKKEVEKIFIKENITSNTISPPPPKNEVQYTDDPVLNGILNETANKYEEDYPTMSGKAYDSSRVSELLGYGNVMGGNDEMKRKAAAVDTAHKAGVNPENVPGDVMNALTKDYRGVMKAIDKKKNK